MPSSVCFGFRPYDHDLHSSFSCVHQGRMGSFDQPYFSKIWSLQFVTITVNLLGVSKKGDSPHSRGFEGRDSLTVIGVAPPEHTIIVLGMTQIPFHAYGISII